jgi:hypothetical protein
VQFSKTGRIGSVISLERRSISCFAVERVECRLFGRKVGTDDSTWVVAIVDIVVDSGSLVSIRCINWVGG